MIGTLGWLALLGLSLLVDFAARQHPTKRKTLTNFIAPLTSRRSGRITLLVFWAFVGFHLFARYTIPQHL